MGEIAVSDRLRGASRLNRIVSDGIDTGWVCVRRVRRIGLRSIGTWLAAGLFAAGTMQPWYAARAEGSRTLYPLGYFSGETGNTTPTATRSSLYRSSSTYLGVLRQQNFFYVYAQAGEYILLGTSGNRSALRLFAAPTSGETLQQRFGVPGLEDPTSMGSGLTLSGTGCANASANISSRSAELAGPNSADGTGTVSSGYAPCYYAVPSTGIYGVFFGTASDTNMWDVTVRSSASSLTDIPGRLFSYSFAGNTGSDTNGTYATHYYVTDDGYRYAQTFHGLAPYRYVLYSNPQGFLDASGDPLYRNVRGQNHTLDTLASGSYFRPAGTGIQAQAPKYPMFFVNVVAGSVDTTNGLRATLNALGIPLVPEHPVALSASFSNANLGSARTYVGQGGVFTISTQHAVSYQIVIKGGSTPEYDDPAHPENRVLTGLATGLNQQVYWDGLTNAGTPMPAGGDYTFEATGRAGEVHFPFLDAESNLNGGPTVTRLNGLDSGESTVYYDDRGYATNGVNVGEPDGNICGASGPSNMPTPSHSLLGVDSNDANLNGTGKYYRFWGAAPNNGNTGNDCAANGYYGDAKGMDLWALIRSSPPPGTLSVEILDRADVTVAASVPTSVAPGGSMMVTGIFGNIGSQPAANVTYTMMLPANVAGGVTCTGATCDYEPTTGLVTISGLPTSLSSGQWTQTVSVRYTAAASGSLDNTVSIATTSAQASANAPDSVSASTLVGSSGTVADVLAQLTAPLTAAGGGVVNVAVSFRNLGPLAASDVAYTINLPAGLAGVSCAPAICTYDNSSGVVEASGLPPVLAAGSNVAVTLTYTAPASGAVTIRASVSTTTAETSTANNSANAVTLISTASFADVTVSVAPPAQAVGGTTVAVPLAFRNLGPQPATGVSYSVAFPAGISGGVTCSAPYSCSYNGMTGVVTLMGMPSTLKIGESVGVTATLTAPPTGSLTFTASIATTTDDGNAQNDFASAVTLLVPASHTVSFDSNGGTPVADLDNVTHGGTIDPPAPPTRVGYVFEGWYKEAELTNLWQFATDTITDATTLYANWDAVLYALSYTAGADGSISGVASQSVAYGGAGSAVTAVADSGHHFASWSDGVMTATRVDTGVTASLFVNATFAINTYTLAYAAGTHGTLSGTTPQTVNHGQSGTSVTAVPDAGYRFVAWSDGVTTATRTDSNVIAAHAVSASFAITTHTLSYTAGTHGTLTGTSPQTVTYGASGAPVTAVPDAGYRFVAWSDGVTTATRVDSNVTDDIAVAASFAADVHTLTYSAGAHGSLSGAATQTVTAGGNGTPVTAVPDAGYRFAAWSDGVATATRTDAAVTTDLAVTASFVASHTLAYTASAWGTLAGDTVQSVPHGGSGTPVTALPNAGYEFYGWSDGRTTATRTDSAVLADVAVTAYFRKTDEIKDLRRGDESEFEIPTGAQLSRLRITRGGHETTIDSPIAADYAGFLECTDTSCRFLARRSGRYELTFVNGIGDAAYVAIFTVAPNVGFSSERQTAAESAIVRVRVVLDDLPIDAQARIAYSVYNDAAIGSPQPVDLVSGEREFIFDTVPNSFTTCFAAGDCFQEVTFMATASMGEIRFELEASPDVIIGDYASHSVELTSSALLPLNATLVLLPGSTMTLGTEEATASVAGLPSGRYRFDWTNSDPSLGIAATVLDIANLTPFAPGLYLIKVVVQDIDNPNRPSLELQTWLRVIAVDDEVTVCGTGGCDDSGTRIPPGLQAPSCGFLPGDPVGMLPYRLQVGAKEWSWNTEGLCLETQPGYGLRLGLVSLLSSPRYGAGILPAAVQQFGNAGYPATNTADAAFTHVGLAYDFEVTSLDAAGQSVAVVVPLPRDLTIPANAVWRKYHAVDGWTTFVADARNTLHSARRIGDDCPSPVAGVWAEHSGLVEGYDCVRIVLQDGGPNDADRKINAVAVDPGTLAVPVPPQEITVTSSGPKGGGGATDPVTLAMAALLLLWRRVRRLVPAVALLAATTSIARADDAAESSSWSIGGNVAWAMGSVGSNDVNASLIARGIPATARVDHRNRSSWRLFGGYRVGRYVSVDGGYVNLGRAVTHVTGVPVGLAELEGVLPASGAGWEVSGTGYLPIGERFELYARIGGWRWKSLYHVLQTEEKRRPKVDGLDPLVGVGVRYSFTDRWDGGLGWDRYRVGGQRVDAVAASLSTRLGKR